MMQVTVNVPETLPQNIVQQFIRQFERMLQREAEKRQISKKPVSKWARIAQEAHEESPLQGLSEYVLECSREIREHFAFQHDGEEG